ncbi:MAG TPA: hypothetical protein VF221_15610 [Chloroflexota bacterium]
MNQSFRSILRRSLLMLAVAGLSAGTLSLGTRQTPLVQAAAAPTITAAIHDNWAGITVVPPNLRYELTRRPHYSLIVTGANLVPGARVRLALLRVDTLQVLQRGSASVQVALIWVPRAQRYIPNPSAGTFTYHAAVGFEYLRTPLRLWWRSVNHLSIEAVSRS